MTVSIQWEVGEWALEPPYLSADQKVCDGLYLALRIKQMWKTPSMPCKPQEAEQKIWEEWVYIFYIGHLQRPK